MSLTLEKLQTMLCMSPGCQCPGSVLRALCHQHAGLSISLDHRDNSLRVACHACGKYVTSIAVASAKPGGLHG